MAISAINPQLLTQLYAGWRTSEDLLTAEFFGTLSYLPPEVILWPALAAALDADGRRLDSAISLPRPPASAAYRFEDWQGSDRPDVGVLFRSSDNAAILDVVIEVKLLSPQSGAQHAPLTQLARYLKSTSNLASPAEPRALVYLTNHWSAPVDELRTARQQTANVECLGPFWTSWAALAAAVHGALALHTDPTRRRILKDLAIILAARGIRAEASYFLFPLELPGHLARGDIFVSWQKSEGQCR